MTEVERTEDRGTFLGKAPEAAEGGVVWGNFAEGVPEILKIRLVFIYYSHGKKVSLLC